MPFEFSQQGEARFQEVLRRYPEENRRAALLPTLYIAQDDNPEGRCLTTEAMEYIAERLSLPPSQVLSVATFYTLYNKRPVGSQHIQVCVSISCAIMGAHKLLHYLEDKLGVRVGETTRDGRFTLSEVECLASCGSAPMLQLNDTYHEHLGTMKAINDLIDPLLKAH